MGIESRDPWYTGTSSSGGTDGNTGGNGGGASLTPEQIALLATKEELLAATSGKKVADIEANNTEHKLTISYTDGTADKIIDVSALVIDIHIDNGTFDKVAGTLKLTDSKGNAITVDLSDFISSAELDTALSTLVDNEALIAALGEKVGNVSLTNELAKFVAKTGGSFTGAIDFEDGASVTSIKGNEVALYVNKGQPNERKFYTNVYDNGNGVYFKPGEDLPSMGFNYVTGKWTINNKEILNYGNTPVKTAQAITDSDKELGVYTGEELLKAIQENALTPSYNYLVKNGSLLEGLENFNIKTNGKQTSFISQKYIEEFSSTATVEIIGNQWGLSNEYFPINPGLTYQADFDVLFDSTDMNTSSVSSFPFYLHFGFLDSDNLVINNTHQQSYGKVMTRDGDVQAGDTEIKILPGSGGVKDLLINHGDGRSGNIYYQGFGNDLKLGGYTNSKGGRYSFTDDVNYSREFVFGASKDLHMDFANCSDTLIKLLKPLTSYQANKINTFPKLIQSYLGGGSYLYIDNYFDEPGTTLEGTGTTILNKPSNLDQVKHITAKISGQGPWVKSKIPYGAARMSIQAIFGLGGGYTPQSKAYIANTSVRAIFDQGEDKHKLIQVPSTVIQAEQTKNVSIDVDIRDAVRVEFIFIEKAGGRRQFSECMVVNSPGLPESLLVSPYGEGYANVFVTNKSNTTSLSIFAHLIDIVLTHIVLHKV